MMNFNRRQFLGTTGAAGIAVATIATGTTAFARPSRQKYDEQVEHLFDETFATKLVDETMGVSFLQKVGGKDEYGLRAAGIKIEKQIWHDIGGAWQERRCKALGMDPSTELPLSFPVFHIYNYVDPSKADKPGWSQCRTNSMYEPYLNLEDAIRQAVAFTDEALDSGEWCVL